MTSLAAQLEQSLDTFRNRQSPVTGSSANADRGRAPSSETVGLSELSDLELSDLGMESVEATGQRESRSRATADSMATGTKAADNEKHAENNVSANANNVTVTGTSKKKGAASNHGYKNGQQSVRSKRERRAERNRREKASTGSEG